MHKQNKWTGHVSKQKLKNIIHLKRPAQSLTDRLNSQKHLKKIVLAVASSLFIGLIFGLITLNMLKQEDPEHASILHSTAEEQETDKIEGDERQFDSMKVYVIQGGVFSKQENAEEWSDSFNSLDFQTVHWKREENYYLFAGIATSLDNATKLADKMNEHDLEVYVKEWEIKEGKIELTEADYKWLTSFLDIWENTLHSLESGAGTMDEEWTSLISSSTELSEPISDLNETVQQYMAESDELSDQKNQYFLLQLIYEYEQLFET